MDVIFVRLDTYIDNYNYRYEEETRIWNRACSRKDLVRKQSLLSQ